MRDSRLPSANTDSELSGRTYANHSTASAPLRGSRHRDQSPSTPTSPDGVPNGRRPGYMARRELMVYEPGGQYRVAPEYESEGSERRSLGSVDVTADVRWTGRLTVPIANGDVAFVQFERRGPTSSSENGSEESTDFCLPIAEVDAVVALLSGIIAQAREDGVLPEA